MPFRTHLGRSLDFSHRSNVALIAMAVLTAGLALVFWLNGSPVEVFWAPVDLYLMWVLIREVDPDHNWSALVAAAGAGAWSLALQPRASALAIAGLIVAARLTTSTTGRRPLPTDLAVVAVFGIAIAFTIEGFIAGFAIAVAIYLDDRLYGESRRMQVVTAAITAIGSAVVATAARAFPQTIPEIVPYMAVATGVVALLLVVRDPAPPISQVDARHAAFVRGDRLHASRALIGMGVFAMTLLVGQEALAFAPALGALLIVLISNEVERLRRPNL
ncbi:MAG TPA: hypothetical protein VFP42_12225 [Acidimicrobiia bacterium]|nr:hypothetical protein [Acidimicrobiia bacterium]